MFGNKLLVYVKKPSVYNLRRIQSVEERKKRVEKRLLASSNLTVATNNKEYKEVFDLVMKDKESEMMKYQKSWLFSPVFTPTHFKFMFLLPAALVLMLMLYIRYIAQPRTLLRYKQKYGISLKKWEKKGWMDNWMEQYNKTDDALTFEAYNVNDLELLYKEGLLRGGSDEQKQMQENRAKKRKNKFVSGSKEFVMKEFNTT